MLTKNNNGYHGSRRYSAGTESSTGFTPAAQSLGASNGGCAPPQPNIMTIYQLPGRLTIEAAFFVFQIIAAFTAAFKYGKNST